MHFGSFSNMPALARIPSDRDTAKRIISYGEDNLYPERMQQVMLLSPITKSAVELMAAFIRGDGFENGDKIVNEQGDTANDILKLISLDQAMFNGYSLHLNSTGIGKVTELQHIDFTYVRLGLPNQRGLIKDCRVSNNWQTISTTLPQNIENEERFLLFDAVQNGREALTTAKGMVLYATPKKNEYPLSSVDAIVETCQADYELAVFRLASISNGFLSTSIFKYPTSGDMDEEVEEMTKKLNQLKGAMGANKVIVAAIDEDYEGGSLIEQIPANNNDSLFINTAQQVRDTIIQNYGTPGSLMAILPNGTLFSAQQIFDDFLFMSSRTKDIRNDIERQFEKFGMDLGKIIPRKFDVTEERQTTTTDGTTTRSTISEQS